MGDSFKEMQELADLMDELPKDGSPPVIEDAPDVDTEPPVAVQQPVLDTERDQAIPTKDTDEEDGSESIDLNELFGDDQPEQQAAPEPPKQSQQPAPDQDQAMSDYNQRIKELSERMQRAEEQRDRLLELQLKQGQQPSGDEGQGSGDEPAIDPDIEEWMKPYVDRAVAAQTKELAPLMEQAKTAQLAASVAQRLPGFTVEDMASLQDAYNSLPPEDQAYYSAGVIGAVALAKEKLPKFSQPQSSGSEPRRKGSSPLANRHRSEIGGEPTSRTQPDQMEARLNKLLSLPDEDILRMADKIENDGFDF